MSASDDHRRDVAAWFGREPLPVFDRDHRRWTAAAWHYRTRSYHHQRRRLRRALYALRAEFLRSLLPRRWWPRGWRR